MEMSNNDDKDKTIPNEIKQSKEQLKQKILDIENEYEYKLNVKLIKLKEKENILDEQYKQKIEYIENDYEIKYNEKLNKLKEIENKLNNALKNLIPTDIISSNNDNNNNIKCEISNQEIKVEQYDMILPKTHYKKD